MYDPTEDRRRARELAAPENKPEEEKEKPQETQAEAVKAAEPKAEKPKTKRKRSKAENQAPSNRSTEQVEWKGKVNRYGYVKVPIGLLRVLGWMNGIGKAKGRDVPVTLTIDKSADTITLQRKKA